MASEKFITNWPRGTQVILRSNEPGPLIIGVIEDYFEKGDMAVVKSEGGRLAVCGGAMSVFDEDRLAALNKLNWHEQYNVMTHWDGVTPFKGEAAPEDWVIFNPNNGIYYAWGVPTKDFDQAAHLTEADARKRLDDIVKDGALGWVTFQLPEAPL